jgi:diguanylate cyclase (GGDEF)-like protein/PAS domain S-box-containing protein
MDVHRPRTVYRQLKTSIAYLFSSLVMVGLLFGLVLWMELDSLLFARLSVLSRSVAMIGKRGNMAARIVLPGRDELSMLANAMNGMLDDLEASQAELRMQEALRESEERYRSLVEVCPDAVIIVSRDSCVFANAAAARLLGYKLAADLVHKNISDFLQPTCLARLGEQISKLADGTETVLRFEGKIICLDGSPADAEIAGTVFEYHNEPALQLVVRDITDKNNHQRQLNHMAHHDHLTGLPNRLLFSDRLSQRLADSRRYNHVTAVMFIDLDRFKFVNDTMGHNIGDMLLREVSARLSTCLRDVDTIARMGGDEFTIILSDIHSVESVTQVARRALDAMAEKFVYDGREVYISGSMGISLYPNDGLDAETLVRNADAAMYRAKEYGGNNYQMYTQELNSVIMEKMKVETDLRKAVEREEFLMYYQPRVDLQTSRVRGMEALIRWKHPSLGIVSPARFIPAAEETGLIIPLSDWVLRTVCAQNKAWQDSGLPCVSVAVNISARHFHHHGDLVGSVKAALDESGLDPQYLEIEVTEHVVLQDIDQAITVLNELRAMGVRISIDDFGTGYSSLTHLKTLPLNMIKIDRSFIKEITTNSDDAAIAGAVVAMAHSLNLRVIAEGVETLEQLHLLRSLECDEMQGYFVSRPVPPEDFACFLQNVDQEALSGIYAA